MHIGDLAESQDVDSHLVPVGSRKLLKGRPPHLQLDTQQVFGCDCTIRSVFVCLITSLLINLVFVRS